MICSNPDCAKKGIDQPPENFYTGRICKECKSRIMKEWYKKNREHSLALRKRIPDDDPETDLVPYPGDGAWSRLTR